MQITAKITFSCLPTHVCASPSEKGPDDSQPCIFATQARSTEKTAGVVRLVEYDARIVRSWLLTRCSNQQPCGCTDHRMRGTGSLAPRFTASQLSDSGRQDTAMCTHTRAGAHSVAPCPLFQRAPCGPMPKTTLNGLAFRPASMKPVSPIGCAQPSLPRWWWARFLPQPFAASVWLSQDHGGNSGTVISVLLRAAWKPRLPTGFARLFRGVPATVRP